MRANEHKKAIIRDQVEEENYFIFTHTPRDNSTLYLTCTVTVSSLFELQFSFSGSIHST